MILTRSQLKQAQRLFDSQQLPDTFPDGIEFAFLQILAQDMTLEGFLAMPEAERQKWWLSSRIMAPDPIGLTDPDTGEDLFDTGFYFEPVTPEILNRVY